MSLFENGRFDGYDNPLRIDTRGERLAAETYKDIRDACHFHPNAGAIITNFEDRHLPNMQFEDKTPQVDILKRGELADRFADGHLGRHPRLKHALKQSIAEASEDGNREVGEVVRNLNETLHKFGRHLKVSPVEGQTSAREYSVTMYDLATMQKIALLRADWRGRK